MAINRGGCFSQQYKHPPFPIYKRVTFKQAPYLILITPPEKSVKTSTL